MLKILPVRNKYYGCLQGIMATLANYYCREYDMMFTSSWTFGYNRNERDQIGECIEFVFRDNIEELLHYFHGIRLTWSVSFEEANSLFTVLEKELAQFPVIMNIDTFNCRWSPAYQKYHVSHDCLIIGNDQKQQKVYCLDPYYSDSIETIYYQDLDNWQGRCCTVRLEKQPDLRETDYIAKFEDCVNYIEQTGMFENLRNFSDDLRDRLDFTVEVTGYQDLFMVPLFKKVQRLASTRKIFASSLEYINRILRYPELEQIILDFKTLADRYDKFQLLLTKSVIGRNEHNKIKLTHNLNDIIVTEYEIYEKIKEKIKN